MPKSDTSPLKSFNLLALLAFGHDLAAASLAWYMAFWLRFNLELPPPYSSSVWSTMLLSMAVGAVSFWKFGLYRGIWRYASLPDLRNIVVTVSVSTMASFLLIFLLQIKHVPRSIAILYPILLVCLMGGSRALYRSWKDRTMYDVNREPILILGAGAAASKLLWDLARNPKWQVVGLLDDDPSKQRREMYGVKVLGNIGSLAHWSKQLAVGTCIIAMPSADATQRQRVLRSCETAGVKVLTVPSLDDLMHDRIAISAIREIEIDELLGRNPVSLDIAGLKHQITDQVVLVSGAGGSIGSELCRQILRFKPRRLVLIEQSEYALYRIEQEFSANHPTALVDYLAGDVKNKQRLQDIFSRFHPSLVFHAAAYKHVPLMETENAWEAIQNNVFGTYCLAMASLEYDVDKFVLISTDKAVNPTNVMGATKRMAELVCQGLQGHHDTDFVIVRFGNVLGSNGSVVPKFREQIERGGPVTVTHPDITRYFMSISEAAQLVLQAGLMGKQGQIFVLDMGTPIKIVDLAREMIRLSGFSEDQIDIEFTGLRPGEKLFEELLADDEHTLPTPHPKLRIARARAAEAKWLELAISWITQERKPTQNELRATLQVFVNEYQPAPVPHA
ncbi:nucleoside-diphosphate sugar epimerase/dehydratase [Chitinivorax sp. PXF-14]|uniref:polysaccharide biosynthesis protein n=1 Tax=Chitinivorax sp. PXF-14 TaxID=3230488 RepID=UPI00346724EB